MFKLIVLFLLSWRVRGDAEVEADTRIMGGQKDSIAPYQVSLRASNGNADVHFCGGSIINKNWIVTAAHCTIKRTPESIIVVAGSKYLSSGGIQYNVSKIINHENFSQKSLKNDISVLEIAGNIAFENNTQPINLPSSDIDAGTLGLVTGWGYTNKKNTVPDNLQMLPVQTLSTQQCNSAVSKSKSPTYRDLIPVTDKQICTYARQKQRPCQEDSGGPLVSRSRELEGVVSWGVPCAKSCCYVLLRVYSYKDWINDKISQ